MCVRVVVRARGWKGEREREREGERERESEEGLAMHSEGRRGRVKENRERESKSKILFSMHKPSAHTSLGEQQPEDGLGKRRTGVWEREGVWGGRGFGFVSAGNRRGSVPRRSVPAW